MGSERPSCPQAQKWLAKKSVKPNLEEELPELGKPRPVGLGLGASFLPHHKGKLMAAGINTQLRKRLARSQEVNAERHGRHDNAAQPGRPDDDGNESSDEDAGRAAAFSPKLKPVANTGAAGAVPPPAKSPHNHPRKKKKRKHQPPPRD